MCGVQADARGIPRARFRAPATGSIPSPRRNVDSAAAKSEIRELNSRRLTNTPRSPPTHAQAAAVFDIGEEYEFEIIKDDDGDGSLTLSVRKIQVRVHPPNFASRSTLSKRP